MAICGNCTSPCTCTVSEDGFFSGSIGEGRNSTQVEGSGTSEDPYVIHFLDQQEFRPKTAEIRINDQIAPSGVVFQPRTSTTLPSGTTIYQSPVSFLVNGDAYGSPDFAQANYFIVGATVTFAEPNPIDTSATTREIQLTSRRTAPLVPILLAGHSSPGGATDPITLSCQAFTPGLFVVVPGLSSVIQGFDLYVYQNSGVSLMLTDIRIWITQI